MPNERNSREKSAVISLTLHNLYFESFDSFFGNLVETFHNFS